MFVFLLFGEILLKLESLLESILGVNVFANLLLEDGLAEFVLVHEVAESVQSHKVALAFE